MMKVMMTLRLCRSLRFPLQQYRSLSNHRIPLGLAWMKEMTTSIKLLTTLGGPNPTDFVHRKGKTMMDILRQYQHRSLNNNVRLQHGTKTHHHQEAPQKGKVHSQGEIFFVKGSREKINISTSNNTTLTLSNRGVHLRLTDH
eukprot:PhF_6_TR13577/c0_g1_i1/m.21713